MRRSPAVAVYSALLSLIRVNALLARFYKSSITRERGSGIWPPPISKENPDAQNFIQNSSRIINYTLYIIHYIL